MYTWQLSRGIHGGAVMKIGIMQPYFLPYIGYWQLINAVDKFVLLDDVNYIMRGYINRNSILINGKEHRFTLPVQQASQNRMIKDTRIAFRRKEKEKFLLMIESAYKKTPKYNDVMPMIRQIVDFEQDEITQYINNSLIIIMDYLGIETKIYVSSEIPKNNSFHGQDRIIEICRQLKADMYVNPCGGRKLYTQAAFAQNGMELYFLDTRDDKIYYSQNQEEFKKNLSIIDVLFHNDVETIKAFLGEYDLHSE